MIFHTVALKVKLNTLFFDGKGEIRRRYEYANQSVLEAANYLILLLLILKGFTDEECKMISELRFEDVGADKQDEILSNIFLARQAAARCPGRAGDIGQVFWIVEAQAFEVKRELMSWSR